MGRFSEAERVFHEEVRDKKRTASGVHHKTGKRGYVGTMRFPSDIMSRKDKYNYRKASKVMTTFLYEQVIPIEQFEKEDKETQRKMLLFWRNNYSNKEIMNKMGLNNSKYYDLVGEHDLPKAPRFNSGAPRKRKTATAKAAPKAKQEQMKLDEQKEVQAPAMPPAQIVETAVQEIIVNGLHIVFNGTYKAEQIVKQLTKFQLLLEDEPDEYYLEFKLVQKQKTKK
jgi:hypothetical protein